MVSKNVKYLRENGPSTGAELPSHSVRSNDRLNGVWSFSPKGNRACSGKTVGTLTRVYYLNGEHPPLSVVEKWADVNETNVEQSSRRAIRTVCRSQGSQFHDAIDEVLPADRQPQGGHQRPSKRECDQCGERVPDSEWPSHRVKCLLGDGPDGSDSVGDVHG